MITPKKRDLSRSLDGQREAKQKPSSRFSKIPAGWISIVYQIKGIEIVGLLLFHYLHYILVDSVHLLWAKGLSDWNPSCSSTMTKMQIEKIQRFYKLILNCGRLQLSDASCSLQGTIYTIYTMYIYTHTCISFDNFYHSDLYYTSFLYEIRLFSYHYVFPGGIPFM